jgi:hypothetical protein
VAEPARLLPVVALLLVFGLFFVWWGAKFIAADSHAKHARDLFESGLPLDGEAEFDRAVGFDGLAQYKRLYGSYLGAAAVSLSQDQDKARQAVAPQFYEHAKEVFSYLQDVPHANAWVDYARFLDGYSAYDPAAKAEAIAAYKRALALDPANPVLASELAGVEAEEPSGG